MLVSSPGVQGQPEGDRRRRGTPEGQVRGVRGQTQGSPAAAGRGRQEAGVKEKIKFCFLIFNLSSL